MFPLFLRITPWIYSIFNANLHDKTCFVRFSLTCHQGVSRAQHNAVFLLYTCMHLYVHSHVLFLSIHQCGQLESSYFCQFYKIFDYFYKDLAAFFMSRLFISCSIWMSFQCLMHMVFCCSGIIFVHLSFLHTPEILWNHQCSWWLNDLLFSVLCWIGNIPAI